MRQHTMTSETAAGILGVTLDADAATLRRAYLEQIKAHPPDRDPEAFERVRDAYELLDNPTRRAQRVLFPQDASRLMSSALDEIVEKRAFVGVQKWLAAMKGK